MFKGTFMCANVQENVQANVKTNLQVCQCSRERLSVRMFNPYLKCKSNIQTTIGGRSLNESIILENACLCFCSERTKIYLGK